MNIEERKQIMIISGRASGLAETFVGRRTQRAIKGRLTRERRNGERWAMAVQYSHEGEDGSVGVDLETGEYGYYPYHLEAVRATSR